eukprot:s2528_g5.t1
MSTPVQTPPNDQSGVFGEESKPLPPADPADAGKDTHPGLLKVEYPPTLLHANPVTRPGWTGPSRCATPTGTEQDDGRSASNQALHALPPPEICTHDATELYPKPMLDIRQSLEMPDPAIRQSSFGTLHPGQPNADEDTPAPCHAMPVTRLGWTGPSRCFPHAGQIGKEEPSLLSMPTSLRTLPSHCQTDGIVENAFIHPGAGNCQAHAPVRPAWQPTDPSKAFASIPGADPTGLLHSGSDATQEVHFALPHNICMRSVTESLEAQLHADLQSCLPDDKPNDSPLPTFAMPFPRLGCEGPAPVSEPEAGNASNIPTMMVYVKHEESTHLIACQMPIDTTPGKLTQAEADLGSMPSMHLSIAPRSLVGTHLPLDLPLHEHQYVQLYQTLPESIKCPFTSVKYSMHASAVHLQLPCTRFEALWRQQAWVASDERTCYLEATQFDDQAHPFPPAVFQAEADATELADEWLAIAIEAAVTDKPWRSAAIVASHWVPVIVVHAGNTIQFLTTPEGSCLLHPASRLAHAQGKTFEAKQRILPHAFSGDCGFQSLAWLIAMLNDLPIEALPALKASQWRHLFVRELCRQNVGHDLFHHLDIGGSKLDIHETQKLTTVLTQHGVWPERSNDRATQASELLVPQGVFKQQDGTLLGPMQVSDVGPNACGVLLVDEEDSQSTLRLPKPVTQHGLAVIVLASKDNADMHQTEPIRFPAMRVSTQQPLIASGYLYQLGSQQVQRHEPAVKLAIDEQPTEAMRCLIFKDQAGKLWDEIQQHPVKQVFQTEPLLAVVDNASRVIDVWDRQWVTKKYEKVRPNSAENFIFSFRMLADKSEALLAKSGQNGIYWEPRAPCRRYPNASYHVTWLSNMNFQNAKYAQQTSPQATTLARHGDRYGLRSDTMNAQEIHTKHRPDTPLLLGQTKMVYAVGPLPFSTTKAALHKLLKAWSWDARPLQPKGRAPDGSGITWHTQATEDPGHWVYALRHGDVLITKLQDAKPNNATMPNSIVASRKTIEHLQGAAAR